MESGSPNDSRASPSTSLPVPASSSTEEHMNEKKAWWFDFQEMSQDDLVLDDQHVYSFLNDLSPLKSDEAARSRQRSSPGMSTPSPASASPHEPDDVLRRLESALVEVDGDHRADKNFLKEDNPVGLSDIISTSFNSQEDKNSNPQYDSNSIKEMVLGDDTVNPSNELQQRLPIVSLDEIRSALLNNFLDHASENLANFMGNDEKFSPYSRTQHHGQCAADQLQVDAQLGYGAHRRLQFEAGRINDVVSPGFQDRTRFLSSETFQGQVPYSFAISANNSLDSVGTKVDLLEELSQGPNNLHNAGKDGQIDDVSLMRKRKKSITTKKGQDCRHCNCKRSKCLKLYCDCFAAGTYCTDSCACENCYNKLGCEDILTSTRQLIATRNPLAFSPKVVRNTMPNVGEQESVAAASPARHKKGCNCKKSKCLKNYCECFQSKVGCSFGCRCENCQNSFGIKIESARSERWEKLHHTAEGITHSISTGNINKFFSRNLLADISNLSPLSHSYVGPTTSSNSSILGDWRGYARDQIQVPVTQLFLLDAAFGRRSPVVSLMGQNDESYPPYASSETMDINVMTQIPRDNNNPSKDILFGSDDGNGSIATSSFDLRSSQKPILPSFPLLTHAPMKSEDKNNQSSNEDQINECVKPANQ